MTQVVTPAKGIRITPPAQGKPNTVSGFTGVYRQRRYGKVRWLAHVKRDGKTTHVGLFDTPQEASDARTEYLIKIEAEAKAATACGAA